jgi:hypothetical protein
MSHYFADKLRKISKQTNNTKKPVVSFYGLADRQLKGL